MLNRFLAVPLALSLGAALALPACDRNSVTCHGGGKSSVERLHDCVRLCEEQGDTKACDRLTEIEPDLHQQCMQRADLEACRALCEGRHDNQAACKRLNELVADK